jgi:hypothetical protein
MTTLMAAALLLLGGQDAQNVGDALDATDSDAPERAKKLLRKWADPQ